MYVASMKHYPPAPAQRGLQVLALHLLHHFLQNAEVPLRTQPQTTNVDREVGTSRGAADAAHAKAKGDLRQTKDWP